MLNISKQILSTNLKDHAEWTAFHNYPIIIIIIIIILYLPSDFRVAYAANISEHSPTQQ